MRQLLRIANTINRHPQTRLNAAILSFIDSGNEQDLAPWKSATEAEKGLEKWFWSVEPLDHKSSTWTEADRRLALIQRTLGIPFGGYILPVNRDGHESLSLPERMKQAATAMHNLESIGIPRESLISALLLRAPAYFEWVMDKQKPPQTCKSVAFKTSPELMRVYQYQAAILEPLFGTTLEHYIHLANDWQFEKALETSPQIVGLLGFILAGSAPQRLHRLLNSGIALPVLSSLQLRYTAGEKWSGILIVPIVAGFGDRYESLLSQALKASICLDARIEISLALMSIDPVRHKPLMMNVFGEYLTQRHFVRALQTRDAINLLGQDGIKLIVDLAAGKKIQARTVGHLLRVFSSIGPRAIDAALAFMDYRASVGEAEHDFERTVLDRDWVEALAVLPRLGTPASSSRIVEVIKSSFTIDSPELLVTCIHAAARHGVHHYADDLWLLSKNKSKPVRQAAAIALAGLGDEALPKAAELLSAKKTDLRMVGVLLLSRIGSERALGALEKSIEQSANSPMQDLLLQGLVGAWKKQGRPPTRTDFTRQIKWLGTKLKAPPNWLGLSQIPRPYWADGEPFSEDEISFLTHRQSQSPDMSIDVDAGAIYTLTDREKSAPFTNALLTSFIASGQDSRDRWALSIAALFGDQATATLLETQLKTWTDNIDKKLTLPAAEALALMDTDRGLCAVYHCAIRCWARMNYIVNAVMYAFEAAAWRRGFTAHELAEQFVPRLGFDLNSPMVLEAGGHKVNLKIGPEFKLLIVDPVKNLPMRSLPPALEKQYAKQVKELATELRDAVKFQTIRLEALFTMQHRWKARPWQELYLKHPILLPVSTGLIWAEYDKSGKVKATFRPLEDGTLTTHQDSPYQLPEQADIGIVHLLELTVQDRQAWASHLTRNFVDPPFKQLERRVYQVEEADLNLESYDGVERKLIEPPNFKVMTQRLGWRPGLVADSGAIETYIKVFAGSGVRATLVIHGLKPDMEPDTLLMLGQLVFTRQERVLRLCDVPACVYSEAVADLAKIPTFG